MTKKSPHLTGLDWLGVSFPKGVDRARIAAAFQPFGVFFGRDWIAGDHDGDRYTAIGGRAAIQADRLRIDVSGHFWPLEVLANAAPAITSIPGLRIHRLDFAIEPADGERLYPKLKKAAIAGHYGGFQKAAVVESWDGGVAAGETLYLGSRQSPSFSRFYRKAGRARWRFEREYKRERAGQAFEALAQNPADSETLRLWAFGGVVFGDRAGAHDHLDRITPFPWWERFSGCRRFESLPPIPPVEATLERSLAWIESQVAPTLKSLQAAGYSERLRDVVAKTKAKPAILAATRELNDSGNFYQK